LELVRALEASLAQGKRRRCSRRAGADEGAVASDAEDAGASGSGGLRMEATYDVLDALKGVQTYQESRPGKAPARSIGLLERDLQDQQKEFQSYQDPHLPVFPSNDPASIANTKINKGINSSYPHPLPRSKNVHPQQLNFGVLNASSPEPDPVSNVHNPHSSVPQQPMKERVSTGQYPDLAMVSQFIEQVFDKRDKADKKAAEEALANGPVYLSGSTFPSPYSNQGLSTPRTGTDRSPSLRARGSGTARSILPPFIEGGYQVKSEETGVAEDDHIFTTQKYIMDVKHICPPLSLCLLRILQVLVVIIRPGGKHLPML
jgi:hypothetical protein